MAKDPRRQQKKLERRAAKRKVKAHQLVKERNVGLAEQLADATRYPVLHCLVSEGLFNRGMGQVLLSRKLPVERVAVAAFLIDRLCLGVKNALANFETAFTYEHQTLSRLRSSTPMVPMEPADARKLVEGAVAYARELGFSPHPDYQRARQLFGDIDASASRREFEFGQNGKPFFVAGPFDTPTRIREILKTLRFNLGPNGFHFLTPVLEDCDLD